MPLSGRRRYMARSKARSSTGSPLRLERVDGDEKLFDRASADQVLLDDALEGLRVAAAVPRTLRVNHGDRPAFADAQAVRLGPQDAALVRKPELLQPFLQVVPGRDAGGLVTA